MPGDAQRYERLVENGLSRTHVQAMAWVPPGSRVLELGCATGYIGAILVREKGCRVLGVEIDALAAAQARERGLEVVVGSLEDARLRASIAGPFDVVMAMDVLEHVRDPAAVLSCAARWVAPDGRVVVAVPNIAVWSMRLGLLRGRFEYADSGLCDRTHLRFFTHDSLRALVREQGWLVEAELVDAWEVPGLQRLMYEGGLGLRRRFPEDPSRPWQTRVFHGAGRMVKLHQRLGQALGRRWPGLCATHFALLLRPPGTARRA
ncbi:MAG: class I SAM-dependent methyltransferase [Deltaproteobacteria bacterium]|nr:class I SAM-dependent methyltransferase [Deltaproteobacteria bacterium]